MKIASGRDNGQEIGAIRERCRDVRFSGSRLLAKLEEEGVEFEDVMEFDSGLRFSPRRSIESIQEHQPHGSREMGAHRSCIP